jgi:uncharacterized membrane protein YbhN (UPF0104 family)
MSPGRASSLRAAIGTWLAIAAILLIGYRLVLQGADGWQSLALSPGYVVLAALAVLAYVLANAERSRLLVAAVLGRAPAVRTFLDTLVVSRFLNGALPQAGSAYRAVALKHQLALSYRGFIAVHLAAAGFELLLLVPLAVWLLAAGPASAPPPPALLLVVSLLSIALVVVSRPRNAAGSGAPAATSIAALTVLASRSWLPVMLQTGAVLALAAVMQWLAFSAVGLALDLRILVVFVLLNRISQYVSITPGNIGVRELAYGLAGSAIGVSETAAVAASLLLRVLTWLVLLALLAGLRLEATLRRPPA